MTSRTASVLVVLVTAAAACSSDDGSAATSTSPAATSTAAPTATTPPGSDMATTTATFAPTTDPPGTTTPTPTAAETTEEAPPTSSTASTPTSTLTTEPAPELTAAQMADQELARTVLITLASFPDRWIEEPSEDNDSADNDEFEAQFDSCLGRDDDRRVGDDLEALTVTTGDFRPMGDESTSVAHEVVLAPDADTAITAMSEVTVDGAEQCLADVIKRFYETSFAEDPELEAIGVGDVIVTPTARERPADLAVGVMLEVPLTVDGQDVSQFLEVLYQRQGRALSELSFTSLGSPFSRDGYDVLSDEVLVGLAAIAG